MASALFKHGPERLAEVLRGVRAWLEEREYVSLEQAKGSVSQASCPDPDAFERSNYMKAVVNYSSPYDWRSSAAEPRA
jgi:dihydroorotate dehydrogenase (fumarate)